jgi:hypothetical protein
MYGHLNPRSRKLIEGLIAGESISVGGEPAIRFSLEQRQLLAVIAAELPRLARGRELLKQIETCLGVLKELPTFTPPPNSKPTAVQGLWRFGQLRAFSFRGLAPAGREWCFDFAVQSHLFFGPN